VQIAIDVDDVTLDKLGAAIARHMSCTIPADRVNAAPGATETRAAEDPWGSPGVLDNPGAASTPPPETTVVSGGKTWRLNVAGAPRCQCGETAALQEGTGKKGPWKRWACAKGAGDDWRSKCDYSSFF
jgi:hypothetical protein